MSQHTEGPWMLFEGTPCVGPVVAVLGGGQGIAMCGMRARPPEEAMANARRVVAAVNACQGIPTEALEGGLVVQMLAALEMARQFIENGLLLGYIQVTNESGDCIREVLPAIRAVLHKAKGATP